MYKADKVWTDRQTDGQTPRNYSMMILDHDPINDQQPLQRANVIWEENYRVNRNEPCD